VDPRAASFENTRTNAAPSKSAVGDEQQNSSKNKTRSTTIIHGKERIFLLCHECETDVFILSIWWFQACQKQSRPSAMHTADCLYLSHFRYLCKGNTHPESSQGPSGSCCMRSFGKQSHGDRVRNRLFAQVGGGRYASHLCLCEPRTSVCATIMTTICEIWQCLS
jgi:hypothetical protein